MSIWSSIKDKIKIGKDNLVNDIIKAESFLKLSIPNTIQSRITPPDSKHNNTGKVESNQSVATPLNQIKLVNEITKASNTANKSIIQCVEPCSLLNRFPKYDEEEAIKGLKAVKNKYGVEMAVIVEKMYRMETAHFTSQQFKKTGTGGMEVFEGPPYYGWDENFFINNPEYAPIGSTGMFENVGLSTQGGNMQITNIQKQFVVMPSVEAAMMFKAEYIKRHDGNYARWFSKEPEQQKIYRDSLIGVKPKIVNSLSDGEV